MPATSESPASFPHECLVGTKRELCETVEPSPLTLALSPNPRNGLGEREDIVGTLTQGGARGSCLALALGYNPPPRWGSTLKKRPPAASQISSLHIPSPTEEASHFRFRHPERSAKHPWKRD